MTTDDLRGVPAVEFIAAEYGITPDQVRRTADDLRTRGAEYRIDFQVMRRQVGEEDFTEHGFGSSGAWGTVAQASHIAASAIEAREWETADGMPNPDDLETS